MAIIDSLARRVNPGLPGNPLQPNPFSPGQM
jgi:hypothetical protein